MSTRRSSGATGLIRYVEPSGSVSGLKKYTLDPV
jgi:hypothetical protein